MKRSRAVVVVVLAVAVVALAATAPAQSVDSAWVVPSHLSFTSEPVLYPTYVPVYLADTVILWSTNAPAAYNCYVQGGPGSFVSVPQPNGYTNSWVEILVCVNDLEVGTYGDTVVFNVDGVASPVRLSVELTIVPEGGADSAWVVPSSVFVTSEIGSTTPISRPLWLTSTLGPTPYDSYVMGPESSFVSVDPPSGITMDSLRVVIDPSGLPLGYHTDTVVFEVEGISDPVLLGVTLEILPVQTTDSAWVEPSFLSYTFKPGTTLPVMDTVFIYSSNAPAPYSCWVMGGPWSFVTIPDTSGYTNDTVSLIIDPSGLPIGLHGDTVVFYVSGCQWYAIVEIEAEITTGAGSGKGPFGNQPNPFNPSTTIYFSLDKATDVELTVYDILGREVKCLHHGVLSAGDQQIVWDGTNKTGQQVSTGVYFYRLRTGEQTVNHKMMLIK